MKVIEEKHNNKVSYRVSCWKWGSVLEYTVNDIIDEGSDGKHVICPICDSFIAHNEERIVSKGNN